MSKWVSGIFIGWVIMRLGSEWICKVCEYKNGLLCEMIIRYKCDKVMVKCSLDQLVMRWVSDRMYGCFLAWVIYWFCDGAISFVIVFVVGGLVDWMIDLLGFWTISWSVEIKKEANSFSTFCTYICINLIWFSCAGYCFELVCLLELILRS